MTKQVYKFNMVALQVSVTTQPPQPYWSMTECRTNRQTHPNTWHFQDKLEDAVHEIQRGNSIIQKLQVQQQFCNYYDYISYSFPPF